MCKAEGGRHIVGIPLQSEWSDLALGLFVYAEPERGASRCVWEEPSTAVAPVLLVMEDVISSQEILLLVSAVI